MQVSVSPSEIKGEIFAPASKSSMQRACAASLVRKAKSIIHNPGTSNDDKSALGVIQALGATVEYLKNGSIKINSEGFLKQSSDNKDLTVNCGESGLGIRMFAAIIALNKNTITINGEGSLLTRPMDFFDEVLPQLGVQITSNNGKLPLVLKGPLQPKDITIDGSLSSQFLTGLLLTYAAAGASSVGIKVIDLKSKPYVDLTLKVMRDFGLHVPENRNYEEFYFTGSEYSDDILQKDVITSADREREILNEELSIGNRDTVIVNDQSAIANLQSAIVEYTVEGDWSGGAFLLVAGAIAGNITVKGLDVNSTQADKAVLQALKDCGCALEIGEGVINIGPGALKSFSFDATDCPDLFPPLVALAAYCGGTTVLKGVQRLTHKESNRALTLQDEFGKLGVTIQLLDDEMYVYGGIGVMAGHVHSRHDHRIAMACAVAALKAEGDVVIDEAQAINKSYPDFYKHIEQLGAAVKKIQLTL